MNWTEYGLSLVTIIVLFLITGYFVSPSFSKKPGNLYRVNRHHIPSSYFTVLVLHALLGGLFLSFALIGTLKNRIVKDTERQSALVWTWSLLLASIWLVIYSYTIMPSPASPRHESIELINL